MKKHSDSKKHKNTRDCVITRSAPHATSIVKAVKHASDKFSEKVMKELKLKLNAAYIIAVEEIQFTKFNFQFLLILKKNAMEHLYLMEHL